MKIKSTLLLVISLLTVNLVLRGQSFSPAFDAFSISKTAYVNLLDGTKLEGTIADIDRKKGLIEEITIKDATGKKTVLKPEQIKDMYLPPSNLAKYMEAMDVVTEAQRWGNDNIDKDIINKGYAYFENSKVFVGKKERTLMAQLVNPGTSGTIKVFRDPFAKETMGIGIAGVDLVGGDDKSYYVKVGDKTAFRLYKKDYKSEFNNIFGNCKAAWEAAGKNPSWSDFAKHVSIFSKECEKK